MSVKCGGTGASFADIQVDGVQVSTGNPTLDFDDADFTLTESPTDSFDITIDDSGIDHTAIANIGSTTHADIDSRLGYASSTGVITGGVLSIGSPTTTGTISDGSGQIVDGTSVTDVSWTGKTNIAVTNIATNIITFVSIDTNGDVVQRTTKPTNTQTRNEIYLGVWVHVDKTVVNTVNNEQSVAMQPSQQAQDLAKAIGFFNVTGNVYSASGADLTIDKSLGSLYFVGSNYVNNIKDPSLLSLAALTDATFQYRFQDGTNGTTDTTLDPDIWDDGGTSAAVSNNRWTVQRIYSFISNAVKIQPGQKVYTSLAAAREGINLDSFVTEPSIAANGLLRGFIIVKKGVTDLSDTSTTQFIESEKFGTSTGSGGLSVTDLQGAYNNSVTPEVVLESAQGAFSIQDNATPIGANLFEVQINGGATDFFAVTVDGVDVVGAITVTGLVDGRDIATDGSAQDTHIADSSDDHTQYARLAGRSGGQTLIGGIDANDDLILKSSSNVLLGNVMLTDTEALQLDPFGALSGNTTEIRFLELAANGSSYVGFKAANSFSGNVIWTLPDADGSSGQLLTTDSSGVLSWSAVTLTAGVGLSGGGDISTNRTFTVDLNELTTETSIASGDFITMVDITDSGSGKITFANLESTLNHDSLTGFVANEHIDHTSVTLTAGVGLSGGGDISTNRTFTVDLNELATETSIASGDFIAMVDITDSGSGKITAANFQAALNVEAFATAFTAGSVVFSDGSNLVQDNAGIFFDSGNNRLGVGNAAPSVTLDITGVTKLSDDLTVGATTLFVDVSVEQVTVGSTSTPEKFNVINAGACNIQVEATDTSVAGIMVKNTGNEWTMRAAGTTGNLQFRDVTAGVNVVTFVSGAPVNSIFIESGGDIGIGTNVATALLDIKGDCEIVGDLTVDTTTFHVDAANGRVGINDTTPSDDLQIVASGNDLSIVKITGTTADANAIDFAFAQDTDGNAQAFRFAPEFQPASDTGTSYGMNLNYHMGNTAFDVTNLYCHFARLTTDADYSGDLGTVYNFRADGLSHLGSGAITNFRGFYAADETAATNNYGFYSDMALASGSFGLYFPGTAANHLAGTLSVGLTAVLGTISASQGSVTGGVPVLYLGQADVSEEMMQFNSTIGTGNAIEAVGAKALTTTHFIKVTLTGGLTRYIPCGTIA